MNSRKICIWMFLLKNSNTKWDLNTHGPRPVFFVFCFVLWPFPPQHMWSCVLIFEWYSIAWMCRNLFKLHMCWQVRTFPELFVLQTMLLRIAFYADLIHIITCLWIISLGRITGCRMVRSKGRRVFHVCASHKFERLTCSPVVEDGASVLIPLPALDSYLSLWEPSHRLASKAQSVQAFPLNPLYLLLPCRP